MAAGKTICSLTSLEWRYLNLAFRGFGPGLPKEVVVGAASSYSLLG